MINRKSVEIERMIKSMLPTLSRNEELLLNTLPASYHLDVPYVVQKEMHWSGAAVLQMIALYFGMDLGPQNTIVKEAGWDDWRFFDHSTFREKIARYVIRKGFLYSHYYPAGHIAPKMSDGIAATDFIRGNVDTIVNIDNHYLKALLVSREAPVFIRIHFTTSDYHMPEAMANKLDFSGHAVLVVGYNEKGFILHDPWDGNRWGGALGGANLFLSNELLASTNMRVDCTLDYMADISRLQCRILPIRESVYTGKLDITLQAVCRWPGIKGILGDWYKLEKLQATLEPPAGFSCKVPQVLLDREQGLCPGEEAVFSWQINAGETMGSFPVQCRFSGTLNFPKVPWEAHSSDERGEISVTANARVCVFEKEFLSRFGRP